MLSLVLQACTTHSPNEQAPERSADSVSAIPDGLLDSLSGHWMLTDLSIESGETGSGRYKTQTLKDILYGLKYTPLQLGNTGKAIETNHYDHRLLNLYWSFLEPDTLLLHNDTIRQIFHIQSYRNGLLQTHYIPGENRETSQRLYCNFSQLHPEKGGVPDLFIPALSAWRTIPLKQESEQAIKHRLKSLLLYNAAYIRGIHFSSYQGLNTKHLNLPYDYYRGGMVLKPLDKCVNFQMLFFNTTDSKKAYQLLEQLSSTVKFPRIPHNKNFMLEYATYMDLLANNL